MLHYATRRLLGLTLVWAVALIVTFFAVRAVPGDPIMVMLSDHAGDAALEARLRADYGLDQPLAVQFLTYIGDVLNGTFGLSYRYVGSTVIDVIRDGMTITPLLALSALFIAVPLGLFFGVFAAVRAGSWADTGVILMLVAFISIPSFALAALLVWLLSLKLALLPVAGWGDPVHLILPVVVLVVSPMAVIARLTRTYMLEVLDRDFVRTARAKGVREMRVIWRHALGNTMVPIVTSIGLIFGSLLSGAFVVETVFNIPGLGRIAIDSVLARDYPVTMSIVLLFTVFYSLINLCVDLIYAWLDPRIRFDEATA
ncbi:ABC transporter permease [Nitratireductor sp. GISD-1A_MAKvit]|uniref:ABC transporter permease n=1 Tax=Nitratireductor sp. GISD-1A_MAKvit TaxID=3234198 RepID=UPI003466D817